MDIKKLKKYPFCSGRQIDFPPGGNVWSSRTGYYKDQRFS